jgi:hypothetical protein
LIVRVNRLISDILHRQQALLDAAIRSIRIFLSADMADSMETHKFKVIIVGGSIAGLTLAHSLSKANIDHIVIEKRAEIAPQEGAFIGVWPNGAQILDQLGLYQSLEELTAPISRMHLSFPDDYSFSSFLPKTIHERFLPSVSSRISSEIPHMYPDCSNPDLSTPSSHSTDKRFLKYYFRTTPTSQI